MTTCGGNSARRQPSAEELAFFLSQRAAIEATPTDTFPETRTGGYDLFEIEDCTSQVVAGTMYTVNIKVIDVDDGIPDGISYGGWYIHVRIFKPLPHTNQPAEIKAIQTNKQIDTPFSF